MPQQLNGRIVCLLAPQQYPGILGASGGCVPNSGQHSPPSQFKKEDSLQATAATAAILNLSTRYRKSMETISGQALATSTKVIKLGHWKVLCCCSLKELWFVSEMKGKQKRLWCKEFKLDTKEKKNIYIYFFTSFTCHFALESFVGAK